MLILQSLALGQIRPFWLLGEGLATVFHSGRGGEAHGLAKDTQPSNRPPRQPKAGGGHAGRRAGVPPGAATPLLPTCAFQLRLLIGAQQRESGARPGWRSVMPPAASEGEQLGLSCGKGAARFTGQFPREAGLAVTAEAGQTEHLRGGLLGLPGPGSQPTASSRLSCWGSPSKLSLFHYLKIPTEHFFC